MTILAASGAFGVIGLAIAWRAAQRGLRVTVADPDPGGGASHAAAGMLRPVAEAAYAERHLFGLGSLSLRLYPAFAAELTERTGMPTGFRQTGTLQVGYDADDMAMLAEHALLRESFGVATHRLSSRECRQAEPLLGPAISGGLLVEDDASVDPRLLTSALLAAARAASVVHLPQRATKLRLDADRASGAHLADGTAGSASQGVLSAGWSAEAAAGLRPGTPDNAPVLGPSQLPGLVLATGHFRSGVLLAPVTADLIADQLVTGTMSEAAAPFSAQRFARQELPWR